MPIKNAIHSQQVYDPTDDSIMAEQELCIHAMCYAPSANTTRSISIGIEKSTGKRCNKREPTAPKEKL